MKVKYRRVGGVCGAVVEVPTPGTPGKVIVTAAGEDLATALHAAALVAERVVSDPVMHALMPDNTLRNVQAIKDLASAALDSPEAIRDAMDGLTGSGRRRLARALHSEALEAMYGGELGVTVTGGDASNRRKKLSASDRRRKKAGARSDLHAKLPQGDDDDQGDDDQGDDDQGDDDQGYGDNNYPPAGQPYQPSAPARSSQGASARNSVRPLKLGDVTIGALPSHGEWIPNYAHGGRRGRRIPLGDVVNSNHPSVAGFWDSVTDLAKQGLDEGWKQAVAHRKEIAMAAAGVAFGPAGAVAAGKAVDLVAASQAAKTPAQKQAVAKAADQIEAKAAKGDPKAILMAHVIAKETAPSAPKGDPHPDDEPHNPDDGHPDDVHAHTEHDGEHEDHAYEPLPDDGHPDAEAHPDAEGDA